MAEPIGPNLVVVGGDNKRLQWLTHHVTSRWPSAAVTTVKAGDAGTLGPVVTQRTPDALIFAIDFADEAAATAVLQQIAQLLRTHSSLYCMVLAEHGSEFCAVRAMKAGAKDYLPLSLISREQLLVAVQEACARRQAKTPSAATILGLDAEGPPLAVAGYGIVKEIATSNFSSVYLARSERLRKHVVLKVMMRGQSAREKDDAERFQREYEIISSITHRAIAEIYDFGSQAQQLYLAMEYFPCGDLRDRLRNPLSVEESIYYLRTLAEALRVIHVFGILHRDLKPANVMLREDNSPVLIDFGLARRQREDAGTTGVGQVLGSPYYISPEQAQGHRVDARTDLYSLGVMFYEMLTGQRPYVGRNALSIMTQHASSPVPRLPEPLATQQPLLDRLMAKTLHARFSTVDELLAELGPAVAAA